MRLEGRHALAAANEARLRSLVAQKLVAEQEYDRAQSELKAILGEMEVLKVAVAQTEIRAPFAGRVGLRRVSPGAYVNTNTVLTTLTDISQLKLDFTLPERYSADVVKGQTFNFKVEGRGETYIGRVVAVEPGIDTSHPQRDRARHRPQPGRPPDPRRLGLGRVRGPLRGGDPDPQPRPRALDQGAQRVPAEGRQGDRARGHHRPAHGGERPDRVRPEPRAT